MPPSNLLRRIQNLAKERPFFIYQRLLNKVPFRPFQIACVLILKLENFPTKRLRGFGVVREGTLNDVDAMSSLDNKDDQIFVDRFNAGEYCVVSTDNAKITGYEWFSAQKDHVESRFQYKLIIPEDSIYTYDAFILPEYRIRGIWLLFQKYISEKMQEIGRDKVIAMVDYGNDASLKTHIRFGFKAYKKAYISRVINKRFFKEVTIPSESFNIKSILSGR